VLLKLSELRVVAFAQFTNKSERIIVTLWILSTKNLFLTAQPSGYHFILACQGCFECTKLHIHTSYPSTSQLLFWNVFLEIIWVNSAWDILQSFVVAFNEQVQNIEKSKVSFVKVISCLATVKARIQQRQ